jgi:hypothetical protein
MSRAQLVGLVRGIPESGIFTRDLISDISPCFLGVGLTRACLYTIADTNSGSP